MYGYSPAFKRHYAKRFDFSDYGRIECVVASGHTAGELVVTASFVISLALKP